MPWKNKGKQKVSYLTANGRVELERTIYWNRQRGSVCPIDLLLGLSAGSYSVGVREMCCRESLNTAFVPASENIQRLAQLDISATTVCQIVEAQGAAVSQAQHKNQLGPDFTFEQCTDKTLITGMDGVMVPLVTEAQKQRRRAAEPQKRLKKKRRSTARACRPRHSRPAGAVQHDRGGTGLAVPIGFGNGPEGR